MQTLLTQQERKPNILFCPYCYKDIPIIRLYNKKGEIQLRLRCSCSSIERKMTIDNYLDTISSPYSHTNKCILHYLLGVKYCFECSVWLCSTCIKYHETNNSHLYALLEREINVLCKQHKSNYVFYCNDCSQNLCIECKYRHLKHKLIKISQVNLNQFESNVLAIEKKIQHNINLLNKFNKHQKSENHLLFTVYQEIEFRENAFLIQELAKNIKASEKLLELYQWLYFTLNTLGKFVCYQVMMLFNSLKINQHTVDSIYLQNNHVLVQEEQYSCIGTFNSKSLISCFCQLDDERFVSGSYDKYITIWSTSTFATIASWIAHNQAVYALTSLENNTFASSAFEKNIKIWDASSYECIRILNFKWIPMNLLQLNDGRLAISFSVDHIELLSLEENKKDTLSDTGNNIQCMIQLSNGFLASCSTHRDILIWNLYQLEFDSCLEGHRSAVNSIIELHDNILISCSNDKMIKIWDLQFNFCTTSINTGDYINFNLVKLNKRQFASSSKSDIKIWNNKLYKCEATLLLNQNKESCLFKLSNGRIIFPTNDNELIVWEPTIFNKYQ